MQSLRFVFGNSSNYYLHFVSRFDAGGFHFDGGQSGLNLGLEQGHLTIDV